MRHYAGENGENQQQISGHVHLWRRDAGATAPDEKATYPFSCVKAVWSTTQVHRIHKSFHPVAQPGGAYGVEQGNYFLCDWYAAAIARKAKNGQSESRTCSVRIFETFAIASVAIALGSPAVSQEAPEMPTPASARAQSAVTAPTPVISPTPAVRILEEFKAADVKFDVNELVDILRDRRH